MFTYLRNGNVVLYKHVIITYKNFIFKSQLFYLLIYSPDMNWMSTKNT